MTDSFEQLLNKLKSYEKEMNNLWREYNPTDTGLKMEITAMKMSIVLYKYLISCAETINNAYGERCFKFIREGLTVLTYGLTAVSALKGSIMILPAILGSLGLSLKNYNYESKTGLVLTAEQADELIELIEAFENHYLSLIDSIMKQIDIFEDDEVLESLPEPEKSQRIACKRLMQFLRNENESLTFDDEGFIKEIRDIINNSFDTNENNVYELIQQADNSYQDLNQSLTRLNKRNDRMSRFHRIFR